MFLKYISEYLSMNSKMYNFVRKIIAKCLLIDSLVKKLVVLFSLMAVFLFSFYSKTFRCNFWLQYNSKQNDVEGEQVG